MAERIFFIHDSAEIAEQQQAFRHKLATNIAKGQRAFQEGAITPFAGHSREVVRKEYNFLLRFTEKSERAIRERIIYPYKEIASRHGIKAVYPFDGDMPSHTTITLAYFDNTQESERYGGELSQNKHLRRIACVLTGISIPFNRFVPSGRDSYISVGEFTPPAYPLFKARKLISRIYEQNAAHPLHALDYQDIVHSTVARITEVPPIKEQLIHFMSDLQRYVTEPLYQTPIIATVSEVYQGPSYPYHAARNSPLVNEET